MNDRVPGSSPYNAIPYRDWSIYVSDSCLPAESFAFVHNDYDGDGDPRHGYAPTVTAAMAMIDEIEAGE